MRRWSFSLVAVAMLVLGLVAALSLGTTAQEATPSAMADHPVVGVWQWDNDLDNPGTDISLGIFHADGTYTEPSPGAGVGVGVWEPTGERTADLTLVYLDINEDPLVVEPGTGKFWLAVEVDASGTMIRAPGIIRASTADGTVVYEGEFLAQGTRVDVEPMPSLGTPVAATPAT
jgi:hypothetical protein